MPSASEDLYPTDGRSSAATISEGPYRPLAAADGLLSGATRTVFGVDLTIFSWQDAYLLAPAEFS